MFRPFLQINQPEFSGRQYKISASRDAGNRACETVVCSARANLVGSMTANLDLNFTKKIGAQPTNHEGGDILGQATVTNRLHRSQEIVLLMC